MDRLSDPQGNPLRNPPRGNPDRPNGNRQERRAAAAWRRVQTAISESSAESPAEPKYRRSQMEGFERRLQNLQDQFKGKVRPSAENLLTSSPFVDEIMDYRAPADLKIPEHVTFDGTGDPREHLVSYQAKMQVLGVEEPHMFKAFLPTLKGLAQKWFLALPSCSIRCFNDLADRFLTHYAVNIKPQRNLTHLSGISQDEGEALKTYLARWQKEVQTIEGLDEQVAITFFMESLRAGKLFIDLHNDRPRTYVEAIQRASRQADTEEAVRQKRQREAAGSSAK
ncbi:uncharacterized protein LOC116001204 [Ipomoea triloba]|uniref:uncharacterized protein LOC116001204 n=1 Tax=Ipomoea triloba TaxID=35885 RepID=UPI00125E818C|nr:uncharacterized protein LOC116001204 [Ipomoea triloba]